MFTFFKARWKKRKENHATQVTKNQKTKIWDERNNNHICLNKRNDFVQNFVVLGMFAHFAKLVIWCFFVDTLISINAFIRCQILSSSLHVSWFILPKRVEYSSRKLKRSTYFTVLDLTENVIHQFFMKFMLFCDFANKSE